MNFENANNDIDPKIQLLLNWNKGSLAGAKSRLSKQIGISPAAVNKLFSGANKPGFDTVIKLSKTFKLPIPEIENIFGIVRGEKVKKIALAKETQLVPIMGVSSASNTMFILEEKKGYLTTKKEGPDDFAIEVLGNCMEDPNDPRHSIYNGDTIIVRPNIPVKDGDVVVARIGEESTIKRIFFNKKNNTIDLQPDNPKCKTLHFKAIDVEIIGKVVKKDEPIISKKRREK